MRVLPPGPDDERQRAWEVESLVLYRRGTETACALAIPLVLGFVLLDLVVEQADVAFFVMLRLACATAVGVVLAVLKTPAGVRHPIALGLLASSLIGLMLDLMVLQTGREASPYFAGIMLVQTSITMLIPWPPMWSLVSSTLLVGSYVLCIVAGGPVDDWRALVSNLIFMVTTAAIGIVATAIRERLRRAEFESRTALAEALSHKSEFMAKMSHELRTPLHVIIGYADILLEDEDGDPTASRQLVGQIRARSLLLHRLISDLLDYAKIEAGRMELRLEPVRVADLIERVAASFRPLLTRKHLALETATAGAPPEVVSDARKLEQILTNLVANAVKFTEQGGVRIEARRVGGAEPLPPGLTPLTGSADGPASEGVAILIHDTGIGIRAEDVPRLASDFLQVNGSPERYGGTGLGLSISKKLATLLGGRIAVRSRPAEGTTFALVLPLAGPRQKAA